MCDTSDQEESIKTISKQRTIDLQVWPRGKNRILQIRTQPPQQEETSNDDRKKRTKNRKSNKIITSRKTTTGITAAASKQRNTDGVGYFL